MFHNLLMSVDKTFHHINWVVHVITESIVSELQKNLNMIEEIRGYLKVVRSFPLMSLDFLENLRTIGGKNANNQAEK